jgi:alpha-tubulin suppressor-like RCC1 family protein
MALIAKQRAARRRKGCLILAGFILAACACPAFFTGRALLATRYSDVPLLVKGVRDVKAVAAGEGFSLALTADGSVWAWGDNEFGQLGLGSRDDQRTPRRVPLAGRATAIAAGRATSYAVTEGGEVWSWGDNLLGRLGTSVVPIVCARGRSFGEPGGISTRPVRVEGLTGVATIAAGDTHALALTAGGEVWGWGENQWDQTGWRGEECRNISTDRSNAFVRTPLRVQLPTRATAIAAGGTHSLALAEDGLVWSWGANTFGQLGNSLPGDKHFIPVQVSGIAGVTAIAGGESTSIAVAREPAGQETVWIWGRGASGATCQFASGTPYQTTSPCSVAPVSVTGLPGATAAAARTSAVKKVSTPLRTQYWDIGEADPPASTLYGQIYLDAALLIIAADGQLWYWDSGRTAGASGTVTARPLGFGGVRAVSTSDSHYLALKNDGTVWAWGLNDKGQLGR